MREGWVELFDSLEKLYASEGSDFARDAQKILIESSSLLPTKQASLAPACRHLPALQRDSSALSDLIISLSDQFSWGYSNGAKANQQLSENLAYVERIGPTGMIVDSRMRIGFFLQGPKISYLKHWHPAEELYYVVQGKSGWVVDDLPFQDKKSGDWILHRSMQPHAMLTYDQPMLALWAWRGDLSTAAYEIVAS